MWLLGEDGSGKERWWHNLLPRDLSPQAVLSGGRKWGGQVESLPQGSLGPARVPQGTSHVFKPLGFFAARGKCPLCCREPSPCLLRQEKERTCWAPKCTKPLHSTQHKFRVSSRQQIQRAPGGVREEAPAPGRGCGELGAAAVGAEGRAARCAPSSPFCQEATACRRHSSVLWVLHLECPVLTFAQTWSWQTLISIIALIDFSSLTSKFLQQTAWNC